MTNDDLGRFGESTFRGWCALISYVVNSSTEHDATGWDCKVEPKNLQIENSRLHDLVPENSYSHATYDVQVKTTSINGKNKWSIRLDHLIRFAHALNPAFICIIQVDNAFAVSGVYLIHIDKKRIHDILKKQRSILSKGNSINKQTMTVHAREDEYITKDFHIKIGDQFKEVIEGSFKKYSQNKQNILNTAGYDEKSFSVSFKAPAQDVIHSSLGLLKEVELTNFTMTNNRFGIPITKEIEKGSFQFLPGNQIGTLRVGCPNKPMQTYVVNLQFLPWKSHGNESYFMSIVNDAFIIAIGTTMITIKYRTEGKISYTNFKTFIQVRTSIIERCSIKLAYNNQVLDLLPPSLITADSIQSYAADNIHFLHLLDILDFLEKQDVFIENVAPTIITQQNEAVESLYLLNTNAQIGSFELNGVFIECNIENFVLPFMLVLNFGDTSVAFFYAIDELQVFKKRKTREKGKLSLTLGRKSMENLKFLKCVQFDNKEYEKFNEKEYEYIEEALLQIYDKKDFISLENKRILNLSASVEY